MKLLTSLWNLISPDQRPDWEKARERDFIVAVNKLKTLSVSERGGLSIDPEELREQVVASREQLKHLVRKPGAPSRPFKALGDPQVEQGAKSTVGASVDALDCIEVVAWRRLPSGGAVRYVCLQSTSGGKYAVATANLSSGNTDSLPPWVDANTNRQVASALRGSELRWFGSVSEAMDAWDAGL
ncbi:hypothetical protein [Pseudomonas protegens]|uniref:hypothetical protein n=1 Tax=Pseudomonas protegens TaxID=380021 RepID=UPI000F4B9D95